MKHQDLLPGPTLVVCAAGLATTAFACSGAQSHGEQVAATTQALAVQINMSSNAIGRVTSSGAGGERVYYQ
jgi:hypothetical protein